MRLLARVAANPQIARVEAAWGAASLGTWAFSKLLALYAYERGGVGAVGVAALVRMLPSAVAAPYTAMLVDRHSRRVVLIVSALVRSALMAGIGVAVAAGAPLAVVLVLAAAFTVVSTAHKPAQAALLPQLARTHDELAAANVGWSIMDNGGFLAGSLTAGALAGLTSLSTALTLCAIPFVLAAAALKDMPADPRPEGLPEAEANGLRVELL
jgi:MFS family permease